ncbi:MAG TPA: TIGR00282 family metallophosphoesterase [Candidatus Baltobacteraceae bacterium]|nr:TIGR00282 family metallophosphoesterase [Candidatus Baltobacteraceae bacterium]
MKILFIGDIVGSPGRKIVHERLADILKQRQIDLCIINCENSASGFGVTPRIAEELFAAGADVLTSGNHIWKRKEIIEYFPGQPRLLRPANFPSGSPGGGLYVGEKNDTGYAVLDLQGRTFMTPIDDPFRTAERELAKIPPNVKVIVVDVHAEATSEKVAMGWFLDGKVSAVLGTHTHVPTADFRVLPQGTAYVTDVGMTGPHDSVIGMEKQGILEHFLDNTMPSRFVVAEGDIQMNCVLIDVDESTGRARLIDRLNFRLDS